MNDSATLSAPGHRPSAEESVGATRLRGRRLVAARAVVFPLIACTLGLGVYALVYAPRLAIPCSDTITRCILEPQQVAPLGRLGITPAELMVGVVALSCLAIALSNGVAALLLWRRSDDVMALLVALTLVLMPATFTPIFRTLPGVWFTVGALVSTLGFSSLILLLGLFPSGRMVPRWLWLPVLVLAVDPFIPILLPTTTIPNAIFLPFLLGSFLCLIGSQIYRYRSVATTVQRHQTKWAVTGLVLVLVVNQVFWQPVAWSPALQRPDALFTLLEYPDYFVIICILAGFFGVAVLRFRLYDIDVIIRRTLIYGTLSATLASIYAAAVVAAQVVGQRLTGHTAPPVWLIVITTLLIAGLFNPLRLRLQVLIDRRFYRSKYDAAHTIEAFAANLRSELNLDELSTQLVDVVHSTMQPAHVTLWLRRSVRHPMETSPGVDRHES